MITALPTPPTRSDPVNFSTRADAFLAALPTFASEANALQTDVNNKQVTASTAATNAAASEVAAANSSGATIWVSGTTYAIGAVRFSPSTYRSYRRKTAGAGTTDPASDPTNWAVLSGTGDVDLNSAQTLTNKEIGSGSTVNGVPVGNLVNTTGNQTLTNKAIGSGSTVNGVPVGNLVNTTDNQTVDGIKTFSSTVNLSSTGFRFSNDGSQDSGMYWIGDGRIGFVINGLGVGEVNSNGLDMTLTPSRVGNALAGQSVGGVGTFAFLRRSSDMGGFSAGTTAAGSSLQYSNRTGDFSGSPSGTWICCGFSLVWDRATVWMRIS